MTLTEKDILQRFEQFTHGVRVMMLIDRGISNSNKGSKRWINKLISTNTDEFAKNLEILIEQQYSINNPDIRLYSCVNPRKLEKAINYFQHRQLDLNSLEEKLYFYRKINDRFCSSLMQPENRDGNLFLIDYDKSDAGIASLMLQLEKNNIEILSQYKTPNGWHLITSPFNPNILNEIENVETKKDALILLHTIL